MVDVAQSVRVTDCGSEGRGFESHLPPLKSRRKVFTLRFFVVCDFCLQAAEIPSIKICAFCALLFGCKRKCGCGLRGYIYFYFQRYPRFAYGGRIPSSTPKIRRKVFTLRFFVVCDFCLQAAEIPSIKICACCALLFGSKRKSGCGLRG